MLAKWWWHRTWNPVNLKLIIKLSFVPGYLGCHKFYVDLFLYQMPLEMLPACTPTLHTLATREIQVYKHILTAKL